MVSTCKRVVRFRSMQMTRSCQGVVASSSRSPRGEMGRVGWRK